MGRPCAICGEPAPPSTFENPICLTCLTPEARRRPRPRAPLAAVFFVVLTAAAIAATIVSSLLVTPR